MTPYDEVEKMKAEFHSHGGRLALSATPAKPEGKFMRVVYPHENDRIEIYGASKTELDAKEKELRAKYQK